MWKFFNWYVVLLVTLGFFLSTFFCCRVKRFKRSQRPPFLCSRLFFSTLIHFFNSIYFRLDRIYTVDQISKTITEQSNENNSVQHVQCWSFICSGICWCLDFLYNNISTVASTLGKGGQTGYFYIMYVYVSVYLQA